MPSTTSRRVLAAHILASGLGPAITHAAIPPGQAVAYIYVGQPLDLTIEEYTDLYGVDHSSGIQYGSHAPLVADFLFDDYLPPGQATDIFSGAPTLIYAEAMGAIYKRISTPDINRYSYISSGTLVTDASGAISAWGFQVYEQDLGGQTDALSFSLPGDVSIDKTSRSNYDYSHSLTAFNYNKPGTWYVTLVTLWPEPPAPLVVPEPETAALCLVGLITVAAIGRQRRATHGNPARPLTKGVLV